MNVSKHIVVRGRVQGVGYRAFVERAALKVGIAGWVRNRRDGSVEALFSGDPDRVKALVETCRSGPFAARVDTIQEDEAAPEAMALCRPGELFSVLPTA